MSYPVLRFADHPRVHPIVLQWLNKQSTGAGEEVMGAIANAVHDATGVRFHRFPLTPKRVPAGLSEKRAGARI